LLQSWASSLSNGTLGFSDFHYPQTVQYFILASFPDSFYRFLFILALFICSLGLFLFFSSSKKKMGSNFSELSSFLRMNREKIVKQARISALPRQALYWSLISPVIFIFLLIFEAKFEVHGLGNTIKTAFEHNDLPIFYGSTLCALVFAVAVNVFFLTLSKILQHK